MGRFVLRAVWVAMALQTALPAQLLYSTGSGKTSIFTFYNPLNPPTKAPTTGTQPTAVPYLPISPADLAAQRAALAPFVQSNFVFPPRVDAIPPSPPPKAPAASSPVTQNPTINWQGIQNTGFQPPSPDFAVGPTDAIMVVNSSIAQFTRTGTLVKQTAFGDWFASVLSTICPSGLGQCLLFDPIIHYDQFHGRFLFLISSRDFLTHASYNLISVSNGATYDSGWKIWALNAAMDGTTATSNYADFFRIAYDNVAVYLAGNMYSVAGAFQYGKIRVVKKSELYNPNTTTLSFNDVWNMKNADGTTASSLCPVQPRGVPSAVNPGGLFVNAADKAPASFITVWKLADPLAATLVLNRFNIGNVLPYSAPAPAPQRATADSPTPGPGTLDPGDQRVLKAISRGGFIYTARDTGYLDATTTATYDVIDTTSMALSSQQRLLNMNAFYPAFDVPASTAPGAPIAAANLIVGTTTAPDGSLTFAGITRLKAGEAYFDPGGPSPFRWGDYFGGSVDPVTGGLWVSGEYAKPPSGGFGVWGTWAGYFPWLTAQAFSDVDATNPFFDYINVLSLWQITGGCATAKFCPGDMVTRNQMAALMVRAMFGSTFTYSTTPYFTDVPPSDVYFPFVQKLRDLGITKGCSTTTFCPNDPITRWSAAVLVVRGKMESLYGDNFSFPTAPYFADVPQSDAGFPFVQKMYELGITSGCSPVTFCPNRILTRQEAAVFVTRAFLN